MSVPLIYEVGVTGEDKVKRVFRSIESEAKASASRMETQSRRSVSGRRGTPGDPLLRQAARGFDQIGRAARAADTAAIRARMAGDKRASAERLRQIATEERAAVRASDKAAAAQERAARRAAVTQDRTARKISSGVASTVGGSIKKVVGLGANALAIGGGLLGGLAGGSAIEASIALQHAQGAVLRNSRAAGQESPLTQKELGKRVEGAALATGASQEDVTAGLAAFVAKTGDIKTAVDNMQGFATVAMATGASVEDIGSAAADLAQKFDITSAEGMADALSVLAFQGKKGAFELKNMAEEFPVLASAAARAGMTGTSGVKNLGGLIQIATVGAGKGEATTSLVDAFAELSKHAAELEGQGVHVFKSGKGIGHGEVQNEFKDVIREVISSTKGDSTKLNPIFGLRGIKAVSPLINAYNHASIAAGGGKKGDTAGRAAIDKMIRENIEAGGNFAEIQKDAASALRETSSQLENTRTLFTNAVGGQLLPVLTDLIPKFTEMVPAIADATGVVARFAEETIHNPIPNIGKIIAAKVGLDLAEMGLGKLFQSALDTATKTLMGGTIGTGGALSVFVTGGLVGVTLGAAVGEAAATRLADPGVEAQKTITALAEGTLSDPQEMVKRRATLQAGLTDLQKNGPSTLETIAGGASSLMGGKSASEVQQASIANLQKAIDKLSVALAVGAEKISAASPGGASENAPRRNMPIGAR